MPSRGNFDFQRWDPVAVGSYPGGRSAFGVEDTLGNGWEWTSSLFAPFPGFEPFPFYRGYSANFFDGKHYVMKGASPRTAGVHVAAFVPQLVPAALSVRLRILPLCELIEGSRYADPWWCDPAVNSFAEDVREGSGGPGKRSCRPSIFTTMLAPPCLK